MDAIEQQPKKKVDWLMYIAIIIMLVGCYLVIQELNVCKHPFEKIIDKQLKADYGDAAPDYEYAKLDIYLESDDLFAFTSYDVVGNRIIPLSLTNKTFSIKK